MIINVVVFIAPLVISSWGSPIYLNGVLHGYEIFVDGELYRFITSMFIHSGAMHIVMNMLSIYLIGQVVEKLFKPLTYLSIYFITGIFGSLLLLAIDVDTLAVGASGAIFGIFGALAGFAWVHRKRMHDKFMKFIHDFGMVLLLNLGLGLAIPEIAMSAHMGGLVAGIVSGMVMARYPNYLWAYILGSSILIFLGYNYLASLDVLYVSLHQLYPYFY
jgi:rhomboid protease GluP